MSGLRCEYLPRRSDKYLRLRGLGIVVLTAGRWQLELHLPFAQTAGGALSAFTGWAVLTRSGNSEAVA